MKLYAIIHGEPGTNIETCYSVWTTREKAEQDLKTMPAYDNDFRIVEFDADTHDALEEVRSQTSLY